LMGCDSVVHTMPATSIMRQPFCQDGDDGDGGLRLLARGA
jgi:hypothetical protein